MGLVEYRYCFDVSKTLFMCEKKFFFSEKENLDNMKNNSKLNENLKLNDVSYRSWRLGSLYNTENGELRIFILIS